MSHPDICMLLRAPWRGREQWLRLESPERLLVAHTLEEVPEAMDAAQVAADAGHYVAGYVSYEAAPAFDSALHVSSSGALPLVYFGVFSEPVPVNRPGADSMSSGIESPLIADLDFEQYAATISDIKSYLESGDTYQVNFTFPLRGECPPSAYEQFCAMLNGQKASYAIFIDTPDFSICSASPELFFEKDGNVLLSRPMKGTAPRGIDNEEDARIIQELSASEKNRAENVMIVDMVRNDMGRLASPGSVRVTRSCEWETYPTLHQMISEVECRTEDGVGGIFRALFPCASITGAPKVRTMQIIEELEDYTRGAYTGAIGWIFPDQKARFNVGIRTMILDHRNDTAIYPVGSGIVWDSESSHEYSECMMKADLLNTDQNFQLLESLRLENGELWLLERHVSRLLDSARYFGFQADRTELIDALNTYAANVADGVYKVRILMHANGDLSIEHVALDMDRPHMHELKLDPSFSSTRSPFCRHKTTRRRIYTEARKRVEGCDDVILWNEDGFITETTIANILLRHDQKWVTPPLKHGLLPGTLRAELLESGEIQERAIHRNELVPGCEVQLINSVRGRIPATLIQS